MRFKLFKTRDTDKYFIVDTKDNEISKFKFSIENLLKNPCFVRMFPLGNNVDFLCYFEWDGDGLEEILSKIPEEFI